MRTGRDMYIDHSMDRYNACPIFMHEIGRNAGKGEPYDDY